MSTTTLTLATAAWAAAEASGDPADIKRAEQFDTILASQINLMVKYATTTALINFILREFRDADAS